MIGMGLTLFHLVECGVQDDVQPRLAPLHVNRVMAAVHPPLVGAKQFTCPITPSVCCAAEIVCPNAPLLKALPRNVPECIFQLGHHAPLTPEDAGKLGCSFLDLEALAWHEYLLRFVLGYAPGFQGLVPRIGREIIVFLVVAEANFTRVCLPPAPLDLWPILSVGATASIHLVLLPTPRVLRRLDQVLREGNARPVVDARLLVVLYRPPVPAPIGYAVATPFIHTTLLIPVMLVVAASPPHHWGALRVFLQ
mmetsp:Transcript_55930/g.126173  ORF Transcript_55930/g.126173 Transcript_55930/m.126173 type:complete len:251 (-) Transcript_55930:1241-1993(-)